MPDYIKVGRTERDVEKRMAELDTTALPLPFQCYFACEVADYQKVEKALHVAFDDYRSRKNREFFYRLDPYKVKTLLELMSVKDVTPRSDSFIGEDDAIAVERAVRRGGRFNMARFGIPLGATLRFTQNEAITAIVDGETSVEYNGESLSISRAAELATKECGYSASSLAGPEYWLYEGETLNSIRMRHLSFEQDGD